jgi:hypothetical protein
MQPEATAMLEKILSLRKQPGRQSVLVDNARKMYEDRFHPDKIHEGLVQQIKQTIDTFQG